MYARWRARSGIPAIAFETKLVNQLREDLERRNSDAVPTLLGRKNPEIKSVAARLPLKRQEGAPSGRSFAEPLGVVLVAHMLRIYVGASLTSRPLEGGLDADRLKRVLDYIKTNLFENLTLADLAAIVGLSPHHFGSAFRASMGVSPHRYLLERRIARGKELLITTDATVTMIAHMLGFASHGHFTTSFQRLTGTTPSRFRKDRR